MKLALGTVQFGLDYGIANHQGKISSDDAVGILALARSRGIDTLDTANGYGDSERRLGEMGIGDWRVVSKLPAVPVECRDVVQWIEKTAEESLRRLKVNSLYGFLLHRPQQLLEQDGDQIYAALSQLKSNGIVKKIGVSIYAPSELDSLCGRYEFDLIQAPFNILDHRLIDSGWLSRLSRMGTEVHVRSVFLQGLLLMRADERPRKFSRWDSIWSAWHAWLERIRLTPLQACLRHVLSIVEINKLVIGIDSLVQLKEILNSTEGPIPPVPKELHTDDVALLNPALWNRL